jgi:type IV secretory pathway VirJ component
LLALSASIAPCALATTPVHFGLFGNVHLAEPVGEQRRTIIFLSDKSGWDARAESLTSALAADGALVFGVDLPAYVKEMISIKDECSFPAAHVQEMSDWMQRHQQLKNFSYPLLIGDGAGASFAYAVDAQAPKGTFAGLITLGWDFSLRLPKPICKGDAGEMTQSDGHGQYRIAPIAALPNAWLPLPFAAGARRDGALAVLDTLLKKMPPPEGSIADAPSELAAAVARLTAPVTSAKPLPSEIADLPLVEVPAQGVSAQRIAVILTGDGGWAGLDIAIANELAAHGIQVVGLNTLKFFWQTRKPEEAADALDRIIGHYGAEHPAADFIVLGYSFGAGLVPTLINRAADAARTRIAAGVMISPDAEAVFEIHVGDWFGSTHHEGALPLAPEVAASKVPLICVHGDEEGADSFCPSQAGKPQIKELVLPGGHHYNGDYATLATRIATSLPARAGATH